MFLSNNGLGSYPKPNCGNTHSDILVCNDRVINLNREMEVDLFYGIRSKRSVYGNGSRLNPTVSGYITTLNTENGSRLILR